MNKRIPVICARACRLILNLLAQVAVGLMILAGSAQAVPQAPAESWIVGEVIEIEPVDSLTLNIQPKQTLFRCKLRIQSIEAIAGVENVLRGYEGKTIEALAKEALGTGAVKGQLVRARIAAQGDERGSRYWILETSAVTRAKVR